MKKIVLLFVLFAVILLSSCTGFYTIYMDDSNNQFITTKYNDYYWFTYAPIYGSIGNRHVAFVICFTGSRLEETQVELHSITLTNRNGDTIPYVLGYYFFPHPDTSNVLIEEKSLSVFYMDSVEKNNLFIRATTEIPPRRLNTIQIDYELEVNGVRYKKSCRYEKKIAVNSKPSLPGQPWYF